MLAWTIFIYVFSACSLSAIVSAVAAWKGQRKTALGFAFISALFLFAFLLYLWYNLGRPPMRTMGETRLWYAFFLLIAGIVTYSRWQYKWILSYTGLMSIVFLTINLLKPELHEKTLMPALQSIWFAPHVGIYMFAYAMAGAAFILGIYALVKKKTEVDLLKSADNLVYITVAFLNIGMILGAIWGKSAWGNFWNWDAKESWALITCLVYWFYIHFRLQYPLKKKSAYLLLVISFVALQICWYGVKYLPSAGGSLHIYGN